jgi:hypothetical protein
MSKLRSDSNAVHICSAIVLLFRFGRIEEKSGNIIVLIEPELCTLYFSAQFLDAIVVQNRLFTGGEDEAEVSTGAITNISLYEDVESTVENPISKFIAL